MEAIFVLMKFLFLMFILVGFVGGIGLVLWEVAKQMTKNMKDDDKYES